MALLHNSIANTLKFHLSVLIHSIINVNRCSLWISNSAPHALVIFSFHQGLCGKNATILCLNVSVSVPMDNLQHYIYTQRFSWEQWYRSKICRVFSYDGWTSDCQLSLYPETDVSFTGIVLGMGWANGRRRYIVTPPPIGPAHIRNDPWFSEC